MSKINHEQLFKLRLTVARFGEMDCVEWWNTQEAFDHLFLISAN
jgi:hypothetical protein